MTDTLIGKRVEAIRIRLNMSKSQFGKMIGVSGQYLGMVERGRHAFSLGVIEKICMETGVSADYILFGNRLPANDTAAAAELLSLTNEQIHIALDIIKKIAAFVNTEGGNEALLQEISRQQSLSA